MASGDLRMQRTYATWNTQGYSQEKWQHVKLLAERAEVVFLQEAGWLAEEYPANAEKPGVRDDLYVYGWVGTMTDGSKNNRVSLAIVSRHKADSCGFQGADTRGVGYILLGNLLLGTWHEKRGQGGLGQCMANLTMARYPREAVLTPQHQCIIGGDFNTESIGPVVVGSDRMGVDALNSASYNLLHRLTKTHKPSGHNLDRIYVSKKMRMVHHWCESVGLSDHNPVLATISANGARLNCWDKLRVGWG